MSPSAHPAGDPRHVPEAWPLLMSREQLCAYVGVGAVTLAKVCPVRPVDLGANLVRYNRLQIDAWVASLPAKAVLRLHDDAEGSQDAPSGEAPLIQDGAEAAQDRTVCALDRARARASGGSTRWRKTG